tara:strand:- start:138 stop:710 length:573 start_codon:yes stop_codon:yes gene_type:complete
MADLIIDGTSVISKTGSTVTYNAGTIGDNVVFPSGKFIPLKGITHSDGSTSAVGSDVNMLSISIDLTNYENYILYGWCHTAIAENSNHSNTSRIRLKLNNGSTNKYFASQRQGNGVYNGTPNDTNLITAMSCSGYYVIESAYATTCTLYMNGGINNSSGQFSWGDQGSYTFFDGETPNAGGTLGFLLFHP